MVFGSLSSTAGLSSPQWWVGNRGKRTLRSRKAVGMLANVVWCFLVCLSSHGGAASRSQQQRPSHPCNTVAFVPTNTRAHCFPRCMQAGAAWLQQKQYGALDYAACAAMCFGLLLIASASNTDETAFSFIGGNTQLTHARERVALGLGLGARSRYSCRCVCARAKAW